MRHVRPFYKKACERNVASLKELISVRWKCAAADGTQ